MNRYKYSVVLLSVVVFLTTVQAEDAQLFPNLGSFGPHYSALTANVEL